MRPQKMIPPTPPVISPKISAATAPNSESTLTIIPRVQDQPLPLRKPRPVASQTRLKKRTTGPMTNPIVPIKEPTLGRVERREEKPIIARLAKNPTIPIRISKTASIVIPAGREDLRIMETIWQVVR
jgi:hypothetical protein